MRWRRASSTAVKVFGVAAVALILLVVGLETSYGQTQHVTDVKALDGTWQGTQTDRWGAGEVEWVLANGEVRATVRNPQRGSYTATGTLYLKDGKLFWDGPGSSGTVTLQELDGKRVLKFDLLGKQTRRPVIGEVREVK